MSKDRHSQQTSPKRQRWRFEQAVRAVSRDRIQAALSRDPDMLGDWFLNVVDGIGAFVMCASRVHGLAIMRFSDTVLEAACTDYLLAVGPVFRASAEVDAYCRRVQSEAPAPAIPPDAEGRD